MLVLLQAGSFAQASPSKAEDLDDLNDIAESSAEEQPARGKNFVFERVHQFEAAQACEYKSKTKEYVCSKGKLKKVPFDEVAFDAGVLKGSVGIYVGRMNHSQEVELQPFEGEKLDESLFKNDGSKICIKALGISLVAEDNPVTVSWQEVAISINGEAVNIAPGFAHVNTSNLAQKNTVAPPHSKLKESLHVISESECMMEFVSEEKEDLEIHLWLPYQSGEQKSVLKWTRKIVYKPISEKQAMEWTAEPKLHPSTKEADQEAILASESEQAWPWFAGSAASAATCVTVVPALLFFAINIPTVCSSSIGGPASLLVFYPTMMSSVVLTLMTGAFLFKGATARKDAERLKGVAQKNVLSEEETRDKHAAWLKKRAELGIEDAAAVTF